MYTQKNWKYGFGELFVPMFIAALFTIGGSNPRKHQGIDEQIVVYKHNGILFSLKRETWHVLQSQ